MILLFAKATGQGPTDCTDRFMSESLESTEDEVVWLDIQRGEVLPR